MNARGPQWTPVTDGGDLSAALRGQRLPRAAVADGRCDVCAAETFDRRELAGRVGHGLCLVKAAP